MGNSQEPQDFNISVMPSSLTPVHVAKAAEGLNLYDTASHQVSHFVPLKPGEVGIYVCGATVQSSPHIGHIRAAVAFDIVRRWFLKLGYKVTFVRNVTDIDDKILVKAAAAGQRWWARAYYYEREFTEAYNTLGVLPPTVEPRATGHMSDMIDLIQRILDNGHGYVVTDADGKQTHWVAVEREIDERKKSEADIHRLAFYDVLTGLPNRAALAARFEQEMFLARERQRLLAVCLFDLDHFQAINDRHGAEAGDEILKQVAGRLHGFSGQVHYAARLGGDEFAVLLAPLHKAEDAQRIADKIIASMDMPIPLPGDTQVLTSLSIGIAIYPGTDRFCKLCRTSQLFDYFFFILASGVIKIIVVILHCFFSFFFRNSLKQCI